MLPHERADFRRRHHRAGAHDGDPTLGNVLVDERRREFKGLAEFLGGVHALLAEHLDGDIGQIVHMHRAR